MHISVSTEEKKMFLEWLISQYKDEDNIWLLQEIIEDERKLDIIRFVDSLEDYPKGIHIILHEMIGFHFLFMKGKIKTTDVYTAFHEMQLYAEEAFYISVELPDKENNLLYQSVIEIDDREREAMSQTADELLEDILYKKQIKLLEDKINHALDHQDQLAFKKYTTALKQWKTVAYF